MILETVQGEGGIYPATEEFLKGVRALCDQHGLLMILDEIQCGMGRTGHMFAWQGYGVKPDVMTVAKALGNGMPVGAFLACGPAAAAMVPGDHGTTYGGNPLVTAAAAKVLDLFAERRIDLLGAGFIDTFRYFYPDREGIYSWWSYRFSARAKNAGWRIDYFCASESLKDRLVSADIHTEVMGSDHCPVELVIE